MSITFFLKNHTTCAKLENHNFNAFEVEDPIYNPRFIEEEIYPVINISNFNYAKVVKYFNLNDPEHLYHGELLYKELEVFLSFLTHLELHIINKIDQYRDTEDDLYISRMLPKFTRLVRYSIALKDDIWWS